MLNQSVTVEFDFVYFLFEIILSVTALKVETGNENMWSIQKFVFSFSNLVFWLENQIITQRKTTFYRFLYLKWIKFFQAWSF